MLCVVCKTPSQVLRDFMELEIIRCTSLIPQENVSLIKKKCNANEILERWIIRLYGPFPH